MNRPSPDTPILDGLHLLTLSSFAIAQPTFDILSQNPEFFVAHRARLPELLAVVSALCLLVPAAAFGFVWAASRVGRRTWVGAMSLTIFVLTAAISVQAAKQLADWPTGLVLAIGAGIGALAAAAYMQYGPVRLFVSFLSPACLVFPALFLLQPPVSRFLSPPTGTAAFEGSRIDASTPILMLVFDQFPLTSLLDENGFVDERLYPNFSALSQDAAWFRNATTVSDYTEYAVPAIVTGNYPDPARLPLADDHPGSLFTLLAPTYELEVWESLTDLCPPTACARRSEPLLTRVLPVLSDVAVVYLHILLPDDLASGLPPVTQSWRDFAAEQTVGQRWGEQRRRDRRQDVAALLETIERNAERPVFHFLHLLIPHEPWWYLPSGQRFAVNLRVPGFGRDGKWLDDEWAAARNYQRHLLQVGYADSVVGAIVSRLKETGLYDDTLIVVTADHGASFRPGFSFRGLTEETVADIMLVPLFIKRPGQDVGYVSDRNVETIDIAPTLADELGIRLPWKTDGTSVFDPDRPEREQKTLFFQDARRTLVVEGDLSDAMNAGTARKLRIFGTPAGHFRLPGLSEHDELVGTRLEELSVRERKDDLLVVDFPMLFSSMDPAADFVPAHIVGAVSTEDLIPDSFELAIAINGTVRAITRAYDFPVAGRRGVWETVVDPEAFRPGANTVEVLIIRDGAAGAVSLDLAYTTQTGQPLEQRDAANLIRDEATELWGVEMSGFHNLEWPRQAGPFRWTDGDARLVVPIDPRQAPTELAVEIVATPGARITPLSIALNGCVLFESEVKGRWSERFALDRCPIESETVTIELRSPTIVGEERDSRALGVAVASVALNR